LVLKLNSYGPRPLLAASSRRCGALAMFPMTLIFERVGPIDIEAGHPHRP